MNGCFTLLTYLKRISKLKCVNSDIGSLHRKACPEGFMPPWRIQHEPHTCSEQSLRILMWNASYVQKHSIKPDRKSMETISEKNLEVCISTSLLDANRSLPDIKFGFKIVWKRHAGSWLSRLPLTKNWKIAGTFSQEHCSVFVGRWLQCSQAAPCLKWNEIMPTKIREV